MEGRDIKFVGIFFFFFLVEFNRVSENERVRSHRLNLLQYRFNMIAFKIIILIIRCRYKSLIHRKQTKLFISNQKKKREKNDNLETDYKIDYLSKINPFLYNINIRLI